MKPDVKPTIQEWMNSLPNSARLKAIEISKIFSVNIRDVYRNPSVPPAAEIRDEAKPHSMVTGQTNHFRHQTKYYWRLGDVRKWIKANYP